MNYKHFIFDDVFKRVVRTVLRGSILSLVIPLALISSSVFATHELDSVSGGSVGDPVGVDGAIDAGPILTYSHTVGDKLNRLLVVGVGSEGPGGAQEETIVSVTYGGAALTLIASDAATNGPGQLVELFYLLDPVSGTADVVVTFSGLVNGFSSVAQSYQSIVQLAPEAFVSSAANVDNSNTVDITTITQDALLVNLVSVGDEEVAVTSGSGMTTHHTEFVGTSQTLIATKNGDAPGVHSLVWTYAGTANRLVQIVAAFEVIPDPIASSPVGGVFLVGSSHDLVVVLANPVGAVTYVWMKDGTPIAGAPNAATLSLTDMQTSDSGDYHVEATDDNGTYATVPVSINVTDEIPAANVWGLMVLAALVMIAGMVMVRRRSEEH